MTSRLMLARLAAGQRVTGVCSVENRVSLEGLAGDGELAEESVRLLEGERFFLPLLRCNEGEEGAG